MKSTDPASFENPPALAGSRAAGAPKGISKTALIVLLATATVVCAGIAYYYYSQWKMLKSNPRKIVQQIVQDEVKDVVEKVGKIMVLPEGEQPTIATVVEPARLKDQPFFARAKVGDKVLIYTNARKAILYDPANNKIIEVAPLNIGNP